MPRVQEKVREIFGQALNKSVNPDEAVAVGAAIQAGVLKGDVRDVLLLDVTPLTLGIETLGGVVTPVIPRNTTIPTSKSQVFSTAADGQTSVEIHVLQGERSMATDDKSLGRFILDGLAPAARGLPQIDVTFDIDANGILNVTAIDKATSHEQRIVIQAGSGLTPEEIDRMAKDAEAHAAEDTRRREEVEVRNSADSATYAAEKTLEEHGERVPEELRTRVEAKIKELREALEQNAPTERLHDLTSELGQELQAIGSAVYEAAGAPSADAEQPGGDDQASDGDDEGSTVEGEFREV